MWGHGIYTRLDASDQLLTNGLVNYFLCGDSAPSKARSRWSLSLSCIVRSIWSITCQASLALHHAALAVCIRRKSTGNCMFYQLCTSRCDFCLRFRQVVSCKRKFDPPALWSTWHLHTKKRVVKYVQWVTCLQRWLSRWTVSVLRVEKCCCVVNLGNMHDSDQPYRSCCPWPDVAFSGLNWCVLSWSVLGHNGLMIRTP